MRRAALGTAVASLLLLSACSTGTPSGSRRAKIPRPPVSRRSAVPPRWNTSTTSLSTVTHCCWAATKVCGTRNRCSAATGIRAVRCDGIRTRRRPVPRLRSSDCGQPGAGRPGPDSVHRSRPNVDDVSLTGQVDFHRLVTAETTVMGVNSADGTLRSSADSGATWTLLGAGPYDLALDPKEPSRVLATTANGPEFSTNGGRRLLPSREPHC